MTWDKVTNRRIQTLHPKIRDKVELFINTVEETLGIKLRVTDAYRSIDEQNKIYNKPTDGIDNDGDGIIDNEKRVSWVKGGYSYHNYGLAIDVCKLNDKVDFYITTDIATIAENLGFEWGGRWMSRKQRKLPIEKQKKLIANGEGYDKPHFQYTFGYKCSQLLIMNKTKGFVNV